MHLTSSRSSAFVLSLDVPVLPTHYLTDFFAMDHFQTHAAYVESSSDNIQQADVDWPGANES